MCISGDDDVGGESESVLVRNCAYMEMMMSERESESVSVRKCAHVEKWGVVGEVRPFGSKLEQLNIRNIYQDKRYISR